MSNPKIQEKIDALTKKFNARIEEIKQQGAAKINNITEDSPDPSDTEAMLDMSFDVEWKITSLKFDIPQFTMKTREISFDLPAATMKTKEISWDEPAVRMETRCIAKKPEFTCHGFPPKCTVKMTCMYADFPEVYMKRRVIKLDLPEFTMKTQKIAFDVPEIKFETIEIKLHTPQFYLKKVSVQIEEQKKDLEKVSKDMEQEISQTQLEMQDTLMNEISSDIGIIFSETEERLVSERKKVTQYYDDAISKMKASIKTLKENNAKDEVQKLETQLDTLISDYSNILMKLDKSIIDLHAQQQKAIEGIQISHN